MSIDVITIYIDMLGVSNALRQGEERLEYVAKTISVFRKNFHDQFYGLHNSHWNQQVKDRDSELIIDAPYITSFSDCIQINIQMNLEGLQPYKRQCFIGYVEQRIMLSNGRNMLIIVRRIACNFT